MTAKIEKSDQAWREELTPAQYEILRRKGTEPPFSGGYVHTEDNGVYRCAACETELFDSGTKFDSGTGWPSFTDPAAAENIELHQDRQPVHAPHRGHVRDLRRPPRACLPRRPGREWAALLHQLGGARPRRVQVSERTVDVDAQSALWKSPPQRPQTPRSASLACRSASR